jgi:Ser-tRNA(Ala) deacylase AlaX
MASRPTSETSSKSSTSSAADIRNHSAVHVLRGAVNKALGPRRVTETGTAKTTVQMEGGPNPQQIAELQETAYLKIAEDAELIEFEMEMEEAERYFGRASTTFLTSGRTVHCSGW